MRSGEEGPPTGLVCEKSVYRQRNGFFLVFDFSYFPAFKILELKRYLQNTCTKYVK